MRERRREGADEDADRNTETGLPPAARRPEPKEPGGRSGAGEEGWPAVPDGQQPREKPR